MPTVPIHPQVAAAAQTAAPAAVAPSENPREEMVPSTQEGGGTALLTAEQSDGSEQSSFLSIPESQLPIELDVSIPLREFRVRSLLALEPGTVVESDWGHGTDLPLSAGNVTLAWSEFEVVDSRLAIRVTRLG